MKIRNKLRRHYGKLLVTVIILAAVGWILYVNRDDLDHETIISYGRRIHPAWFLIAFFTLPLAGFPITPLLILAGIRFELPGGMAVVAAGMLFHHVVVFGMTHGLFRERVRRYLDRSGYGIPDIEKKHRVWFTVVFAAVHGPPYAAKLYLLALTDLPFRIYLWVGGPVYVFFALIPVLAGSAVARFELRWLYILIAVTVILAFMGVWIHKRYGKVVTEKSVA